MARGKNEDQRRQTTRGSKPPTPGVARKPRGTVIKKVTSPTTGTSRYVARKEVHGGTWGIDYKSASPRANSAAARKNASAKRRSKKK